VDRNLTDQSAKRISVVCTIYRGASSVAELVERIASTLQEFSTSFEIILVDDYSPDDSWAKIQELCRNRPYVKGVKLSRNFGQQIAMSAGMAQVTGDYTVIMDGDLQNPPSAIPLLVSKLNEGYDIVYTVSKARNNFKDEMSSKIFWFLLTKIFKINIVKNQLMMKGMTNAFISRYNDYGEINRTVSAITNDIGMRYTVIAIENQKRHSGKSNYTFFKRFNLMVEVVISLSTAPLNFMIYIGMLIFLLTIGAAIYYLVKYLIDDVVPGYTSIMLSLFFFGSIIILMLGFIGRYLANIYMEVRRRPLFSVQEKCNFNN
jgi:glycosyltransferase involved in cell wall biosynthesis